MAKNGIGYADWDAVFSSGTPEEVYRRLFGEYGNPTVENSLLEKCKEYARERLCSFLTAKEIPLTVMAQDYGSDKALVSAMMNRKKVFSIPINSWECVCHSLMRVSVHELLLGVNKPVILPRGYSTLAIRMNETLQNDTLIFLGIRGKNMVESYYSSSVDTFGHHRPMAELQRERIAMINDETGNFPFHIFDTEYGVAPASVRGGLSAFYSNPKREWKINTLMYAALCFSAGNLDFLSTEDIGICDMAAVRYGQEPVPVTGAVKEVMRYLLILPPAQRKTYLTLISTCLYMANLL